MYDSKTVLMKKDSLEDLISKLFLAAGLDDWQSNTISQHLVLASLRGVDSHGIIRVPIYLKRIEEGLTNKQLEVSIERETPSTALIDAKNSSGIAIATKGMQLAVQKAKKYGIALVGIKNSNHCGMLAAYTQYAARQDCIALATTNAPPNMAPWGGRERFFGTNPLSYGIPTGSETSIVFDMATSVVARGKIISAHKNNQKIPIGWALSKEGKETTDPQEALEGLCLPVGGPKGYGIALLVDVISGLFTGASYGPHIGDLYKDFENKQNVGHFFFVTRADLFQSLQEFKRSMDKMVKEIKQIPLAEGVERIYLPGEIENKTMKDRKIKGIPVSPEIRNDFIELAIKYQIPTDLITPLQMRENR
ncbi:Ldh family oxidoreductase [Alkalihalobacillus oceani]|uniref:Ldh family oxidoreductase n=1 Tax=Halalkalibacter oceani TaxID=1653776 RepID=UPI002040E13C|nr:Ldh family oxidoreductase [Halalkalibacter oceani]MCM3762292.1 Ldh family oxidoreductase [Halalkalibacter oceani]